MTDPHVAPPDYKLLSAEGERLNAMMKVDPPLRSHDELSYNGALRLVSVRKFSSQYLIQADLPHGLKHCTHCGSANLKMHGRWITRLADIPYIDPQGVASSVEYAITVQRYQCADCGKGVVEPMPANVAAAVTNSRITYRLSCWLLYILSTEVPYETVHRMLNYSTVWVRKWYTEARQIFNLGSKPSRPGRKPKTRPVAVQEPPAS